MDSHVGLDYIVDNPDYCVKLASALDTACPSVKKQVVELLSALCVYSQDGRQRAIDTLHTYQERKGERYRLRVVVDELQKATAEDYQTALLAFINCLVISTPVLKDRIRIRNEFIGLKLLPILNELRLRFIVPTPSFFARYVMSSARRNNYTVRIGWYTNEGGYAVEAAMDVVVSACTNPNNILNANASE